MLHVLDPEVIGDLVQSGPVMRRVRRIAHPDVVQDRAVPRVVEDGRGQFGPGLAPRQLVEQRAQAGLVEPDAEVIQPGQPPGGLLIGDQRGEQRPGLVGDLAGRGPQVAAEQGELVAAIGLQLLKLIESGRQPGQPAAGAQLLPLGELGSRRTQQPVQLLGRQLRAVARQSVLDRRSL